MTLAEMTYDKTTTLKVGKDKLPDYVLEQCLCRVVFAQGTTYVGQLEFDGFAWTTCDFGIPVMSDTRYLYTGTSRLDILIRNGFVSSESLDDIKTGDFIRTRNGTVMKFKSHEDDKVLFVDADDKPDVCISKDKLDDCIVYKPQVTFLISGVYKDFTGDAWYVSVEDEKAVLLNRALFEGSQDVVHINSPRSSINDFGPFKRIA